MSRLDLFCSVDECWQRCAPAWQRELLASGQRRRMRRGRRSPSERMTIVIRFQQSHDRTCKASCTEHVRRHLRGEFPQVVRSSRFVERMPRVLVPLAVSLPPQLGEGTGVSVSDATTLAVCHTARIGQHRVFARDARRGKTAVGWCSGCQLHRVVNDRGELLAFCLSRGNLDDRRPLPRLVRRLFGTLFGDRGSSSQALAEEVLVAHGVHLVTRLRSNMRNRRLDLTDTLLVRTRAIIESIVDQLKNICPIEHSRHRSPLTVLVNLLAGLIASCQQPKKPSLALDLPALLAA